MATVDDAAQTEQRLREQADVGYPESWKPQPGGELTGTVVKYDKGYTDRGEAWIMVVESLRQPGKFASVWLLHTTLRNEVIKQQPVPGEVVYLRYEGLQQPKHGGEEYHGWKVVVDRTAGNSTGPVPWEADNGPRTEADAMQPYSTGPAARTEHAQPYQEPQPLDDDIPF